MYSTRWTESFFARGYSGSDIRTMPCPLISHVSEALDAVPYKENFPALYSCPFTAEKFEESKAVSIMSKAA